MKNRKRILALLLALCVSFGLESTELWATETISNNSVATSVEMVDDTANDVDEFDVINEVSDELDVEAEKTGIEGFVTRLYSVCLDREPDESGFKDWTGRLSRKEETGIQAAYGFIFSKEFQNKNLCNEDYVEYLYQAFMGRASDAGGKADWVSALQSGKNREAVFNGFACSKEFSNLCKEYGIVVGDAIEVPATGTVPHGKCSVCGKEDDISAFVTRLYQICLDREPDEGGLNDWCSKLRSQTSTGADVSSGFVFSQEFQNKNLDDEDFVEYMYKAFFNRASDAAGKEYWLEKIWYEDMNRSHVFAGFVGSAEFANLCAAYGITVGKYTPVDDALTPDYVARMSYAAREKLIMGEYYGQSTLTKAQADSRMTVITVPVWDFLNTRSMTKVSKTANLTCNKGVAEYFKMAFEDLYNHPSQPVIHPGSFYAYSYRANVNNPSVLSNHSYGTAIDINPGENPNGKAMVTAAAWAAMPQGSVNEMQKKAYTIYEGSPYYEVLYQKYHLYWLGYNRTVDAMHFEF